MALSKRERQLLGGVLALAFLVANTIGFVELHRWQTQLATENQSLKQEKTEHSIWLEERDLWQKREAWLQKHQPVTETGASSNVELLDALIAGAKKYNLKVDEQSLQEPSTTGNIIEVSAKLRVAGSFGALSKWLQELQSPAKMQAVREMILQSDATEAGHVRCDLQVSRLYVKKVSPQ